MSSWLEEAQRKLASMPQQAREVREAAENDLFFFAKLVNPGYMYGPYTKKFTSGSLNTLSTVKGAQTK